MPIDNTKPGAEGAPGVSAAPEKAKRKTVTSNAVKLRYNKKTYLQAGCRLRYDRDSVLISAIEARQQAEGLTVSEAVRALLYDAISGKG